MTWSDSSRDSSDSAQSLSSGVFNAAGVQVKGTCGSSFVTDVIRVDRAGVESAVKILTPGATRDPDLVSRFLTNARYNQSLNDFTGMRISEIVETGPRPYYVMERVAESSLLEIIRLHAPIDPRWLATLLLPTARMLDTIHQRNILHANIKPSNILVVIENNEEKFLLVDFMEPSLAATSATLTGAGVYAAPEFRAGMPVSNRSDIFSLASVMYEALSGNVPTGAYKTADGLFHAWRPGDVARPLNQVNPEISRPVSEIIMNGIAPQAIARPASATAMVEDVLRTLEQPRTRVRVAEPPAQHTPVPMLLITVGVFLAVMLLIGAFVFIKGAFTGSDSPPTTVASSSATTKSTSPPTGEFTEAEIALSAKLPAGNQQCQPNRQVGNAKKWPIATAILDCTAPEVTSLTYGLFGNSTDLDETYKSQAAFMGEAVVSGGGQIVAAKEGTTPCSTNPNESGEWGTKTGSKNGGKFTCVSVPSPRIVWTERNSAIIGDAALTSGTVAELVTWWTIKSGPVG